MLFESGQGWPWIKVSRMNQSFRLALAGRRDGRERPSCMKTWLRRLSTRRSLSASSTRDELPVRQRRWSGGPWSAVGMRDAHACCAGRRLAPAAASSFGEYPGATQTVGGARLRKEEPTLPDAFGSGSRIAFPGIDSAKTGAAVEPPYADSRPSLQIGQPSASWIECDGLVARPSPSSRGHSDAWWSPTDASRDSRPPENCTE